MRRPRPARATPGRAARAPSGAVGDGSASRGRIGRSGLRQGAHPATPVQSEPYLAHLELVAEPERPSRVHRHTVDERAVGAAEVLYVPGPATEGQHRVLRRRERVVDDDGVVDVAAERGHRVQRERRPGRWLAVGRGEHDEPAELRRPTGRPRGGRAAAPAPRRTGTTYSRTRNRIRTSHSVRTKPSTVSRAATRRRAPCRRPGAGRPGPARSRPPGCRSRGCRWCCRGPCRRASLARLQPAVVPGHPRIGEDQAVVAGAAERQRAGRRPRRPLAAVAAGSRGASRARPTAPGGGTRVSGCRHRGCPRRPRRPRQRPRCRRRVRRVAGLQRCGRWPPARRQPGPARTPPARSRTRRSGPDRRWSPASGGSAQARRGVARRPIPGASGRAAASDSIAGVDLDASPRHRGVGDQRDLRTAREVVGVGPRERQRRVGEPARQGSGVLDSAPRRPCPRG